MAQNSKVGTSRCLDTSSTTQMANIIGKIDDPVTPLERNSYGHPLAGLVGKGNWKKLY